MRKVKYVKSEHSSNSADRRPQRRGASPNNRQKERHVLKKSKKQTGLLHFLKHLHYLCIYHKTNMKEFIQSEAKAETAILVALITKNQDERKTAEYLDELEFLAETAGAVAVKRFTQRLDGPSSVTYLGKGKLEEIRRYIEAEEEAER